VERLDCKHIEYRLRNHRKPVSYNTSGELPPWWKRVEKLLGEPYLHIMTGYSFTGYII